MAKEDKVRYYAEITKGLIFAELSAIFAMLAFLFINFDLLNTIKIIIYAVALIIVLSFFILTCLMVFKLGQKLEEL